MDRLLSRPRIIGVVYLLYFVTAILGAVLTSRGLKASGEIVNLFATALYAVVTLLFYFLFRAISFRLSLLAAAFSFLGCIATVLSTFHLVPATRPLLFFGPYCLLLGYLVYTSTFLPRFIGVLLVLAGLGWLAFASPWLAAHLARYVQILGFLAEALLMLWLLIVGVNVRRWRERMAPTRVPAG